MIGETTMNSKADFRRTRAYVLDLGNGQKRTPSKRATVQKLQSRIPPTRYSEMLFRAREMAEPLELIHVHVNASSSRSYLPAPQEA